MLGKLIKNEFKTSAHSVASIYLAAAITIGIMMLSYLVKIKWISTLSTIALLLISVVAIIITLVAVISNFYKTLYGAQGYLSFTLPVKSGQLLASKAIVSFVWLLASYIITITIWIGVYVYATAMVGESVMNAIESLIQMFAGMPDAGVIKQILVIVGIIIFAQIAVFIAEIFFSLTLANTKTFQKIGMVSALIIFFAVFIVMQILTGVLTTYVPVSMIITTEGLELSFTQSMMNSSGGIALGVTGVVFEVLAAAGLFGTTAYLMKHKVNVK